MALDESNARSAPTGAVMVADTTAAAPTGTGGTTTGFTDLGFVGGDGEGDGVTQALPGQGDVTTVKAWQNGAVVRTFRSPTEDNPTWTFTLLETKKETIELYYGATVTQTVTEGSLEYDAGDARPYKSFIIDVIDGAELERVYIPKGIVSEVGDVVRAHGEIIGYEVTIEGERDATRGYNFKTWATALKT